ncbi:restriction endonuclease [Rhodococcus qingshengii]|uniref:restriction endonuclease n=1 Tax=Rhodococcus qingshengii TaxID=334542 RepID=UPI001C8B8849|nr:restriction endonuclease [Rhodococcus qingshengii]MBX9151976.1 restriction endonuclease [Rhodococcus qingshengii]
MPHIHTPQEAEANAALRMRELGFRDASVTGGGADAGIDVRSSAALAQVKWQGGMVGRPTLQALYGARGADLSKKLLFFAASNYSKQAVDYADRNQIALFVYEPLGTLVPMNKHASVLSHRGSPTNVQSQWNRVAALLISLCFVVLGPLLNELWDRSVRPFIAAHWRLMYSIVVTIGAVTGIVILIVAEPEPAQIIGTVIAGISLLNMPIAWWMYVNDLARQKDPVSIAGQP